MFPDWNMVQLEESLIAIRPMQRQAERCQLRPRQCARSSSATGFSVPPRQRFAQSPAAGERHVYPPLTRSPVAASYRCIAVLLPISSDVEPVAHCALQQRLIARLQDTLASEVAVFHCLFKMFQPVRQVV